MDGFARGFIKSAMEQGFSYGEALDIYKSSADGLRDMKIHRPNLKRPNTPRPKITRPEFTRPEFTRPDVDRPDTDRPDELKRGPDLKAPEITPPPPITPPPQITRPPDVTRPEIRAPQINKSMTGLHGGILELGGGRFTDSSGAVEGTEKQAALRPIKERLQRLRERRGETERGPMFQDEPKFETEAPHNTYDLLYGDKRIASIYHKLRTENPSGMYLEPNYDNKDEGKQLISKLLAGNPSALMKLKAQPTNEITPTAVHRVLKQLGVLKDLHNEQKHT